MTKDPRGGLPPDVARVLRNSTERGEQGGSPADFSVTDDLLRADRAASRVHDYLYDLNGVTRAEANAAIWEIHEVLRPLIDPSGRAWQTGVEAE